MGGAVNPEEPGPGEADLRFGSPGASVPWASLYEAANVTRPPLSGSGVG